MAGKIVPIVATAGGFTLPCAPDTMELTCEGKTLSYDFIARGVVELPRGRLPERFVWSGTLYGEVYADVLPYLRGRWMNPLTIRDGLRLWINNGEQDSRLLRIAGAGISTNVYCRRARFGIEGAFGNIPYQVEFYEARAFAGVAAAPGSERGVVLRPGGAQPGTLEVTGRDTWWSLAERGLGDGARWQDVRDANPLEPRSGPTPGTVVTLPAPEINRREQ